MADESTNERRLTSHEQRAGTSWDASYEDGPAPWDIGRPQSTIVRLAAAVQFDGPVLDIGCGTGENALYLASLGLPVLGIDVARTAIALAQEKVQARRVAAEFMVADALQVQRVGRTFSTVIDAGLFHTFDEEERLAYAGTLSQVTRVDGMLYVLCFSDRGPDRGPHPIRDDELRAAFSVAAGWQMVSIVAENVETRFHANGVSAWLATVRRIRPRRR